MINGNQRYKMVTLLKLTKNTYALMFQVTIPGSIFKNNKCIYKVSY